MKSFLKDRTFGPRVLPPLVEAEVESMPDIEVKRYSNIKSAKVAAKARRRYFEGLVKDLQDPESEKAKQRQTHRFEALLCRMDAARQGRTYFHDPAPEPSGKGKSSGKGKGKVTIQERWTVGLVVAGLDVGPYTDRRQQQQQQRQQQPQPWQWHGGGWQGQ